MSENESDVQRERATDDRDNVVLTGEEIELPGDGSDAPRSSARPANRSTRARSSQLQSAA